MGYFILLRNKYKDMALRDIFYAIQEFTEEVSSSLLSLNFFSCSIQYTNATDPISINNQFITFAAVQFSSSKALNALKGANKTGLRQML